MIHRVNQAIAISVRTRCWFNDWKSVSGGGMTRTQNVEEEKVSADRRARDYVNTNHDVRLTVRAVDVIQYESARGTSVSVIHERLKTAYGDEIMSR